jgi:hypothetical protein
MKRDSFIIRLALVFILLSGLMYLAHYLIFRDAHHIYIYLLGDLAFLPLEVFLVVIVIEGLLSRRERQVKLQKMNMVVGAFFSEIGNYLLKNFISNFNNKAEIVSHLNIAGTWTKNDFQKAASFAANLAIEVDSRSLDLVRLKAYLSQKREFLLRLLENPSLLEHDRFTALLWAVTHLDEELEARPSLIGLSDKDLDHLAGDIRRMYGHLASEWLDYVEHLKSKYPFLFSLVLRTHPFQPSPSPSIT